MEYSSNYNPKFLDIHWLKANYKMIHYFGLGFIQLKLNDAERVHFYTDLIHTTVKEEEVHNHRYNFVSTILSGHLEQHVFELDMDSTEKPYYLTQETCNAADKRDFPKVDCNVSLAMINQHVIGDRYYIDHHTFHRVSSTDAITHVKRSGYKKEFADVIFKKGQEVVCPFSVKRTDEELFDIVEEILS